MKKKIDLISGEIDSSLRKFSFPLIVSFLVQNFYTWVDTYYVSRLGAAAIAAVGISEQFIFFMFTLGSGFGVGSAVIIARRFGEGEMAEANKVATQSLIMMFIAATAIAAGFWLALTPLLGLMSISGAEYDLVIDYMTAIVFGIPFFFLMFQINAIVRSTGNSIFPMVVMLISTVLNAIISPLLIFGIWIFPEMGIVGAGTATAISQFTAVIVALISIRMKYTPIEFHLSDLRLRMDIFVRILKLGVPVSLQLFSVSINRIVLFTIANMFGTAVVAGYTLGLKVDLFVFMTVFAVGTAMEIIAGQNIGAGKISRIFRYYKSALSQLGVLIAVLGTVIFMFGDHFVRIFTPDPEIVEIAHTYLRIMVFTYIFFVTGIISTRIITGAGDTVRSLVIVAAILLGVQLPLVWLMAFPLGMEHLGIWWGIFASQIVFAIVGNYHLYKRKWLNKKV
ncbi:MAG: MATE family efflux transporter [Candidatus Kapaibacterium sp.]